MTSTESRIWSSLEDQPESCRRSVDAEAGESSHRWPSSASELASARAARRQPIRSVYANADLTKAEQAREVLAFADYREAMETAPVEGLTCRTGAAVAPVSVGSVQLTVGAARGRRNELR